jgi:class 3 adenylate cyclase
MSMRPPGTSEQLETRRRRAVQLLDERMMQAVHRYEGTANQMTGDGIMR